MDITENLWVPHHSWAQTKQVNYAMPSTVMERFNFPGMGHNVQYASRFYAFPSLTMEKINLEGTVESANYAGVTLAEGHGAIYQPAEPQLRFGPTSTYVDCSLRSFGRFYVTDPNLPGTLTTRSHFDIPNLWQETNYATRVSTECRYTFQPARIVPEYMFVKPSAFELSGTAGEAATGQFTVEIGPVPSDGVVMSLHADVPGDIELTRGGYPWGRGFLGEPVTLLRGGTSIPGYFTVKDSSEGRRTYHIPIQLRYN